MTEAEKEAREALIEQVAKALEDDGWLGHPDELVTADLRIIAEVAVVVFEQASRVPPAASKRRLRTCVERWPGCETGEYNPACCRFPKSCSATVYDPDRVSEDDLEPPAEPAVTDEMVEAFTVAINRAGYVLYRDATRVGLRAALTTKGGPGPMTPDETRAMLAAAREFADALDVELIEFANARIHIHRLADALEAQAMAEQGEWEYGYRLVGDDGNVYKTGFAYDDPRDASERGRARVIEENEVHEANGMPRLSFELIRRRKAGPWESVTPKEER